MVNIRSWCTMALTACTLVVTGCDRNETVPETERRTAATRDPVEAPAPTPVSGERKESPSKVGAKAELKAARGHDIDGSARLYDTGTGVRIVAEVEDAKPGMHGIHIHQKGDCSNIQGESMGGHLAPAGHPHALPGETTTRHLGDLGNIDVTKDGKGHLEITIEGANLKSGDPNSFLGRALVIHAGEDSGKSKQPSGGSGTPIACGVIETA